MRKSSSIVTATSLICVLALGGCFDKSPEKRIQDAKKAIDNDDYKTAAVELKSALQAAPNNLEARMLLSQAQQAQGNWADSEKELEKALKLGASKEQALPLLIRNMIKLGKVQEAIDTPIPTSGIGSQAIATIQAERANAFMFLNKPDAAAQAIRDGEAALANTGQNESSRDLQLAKARLTYKNQQPAQAMALLDQVLQRNPKYSEALYTKAQLLLLEGKDMEALKVYQQITTIKPSDPNPYLAISIIQFHANNIPAAEAAMSSAEKYAPKMPQVMLARAKLEIYQQNYKKANELLQQILQKSPRNVPTLLLYATTNYSLGNHEQSLKDAERVLASYPDDLLAAKLVISNNLWSGNYAKAQEILWPKLKTYPNDVDLLAMAADLHMRSKDYNKAMEFLVRATAIQQTNIEIKKNVAEGYLALGQPDRAIAVLEQAANSSNKSSAADLSLILLRIKRHEYDTALQAITRLEKKDPNNPIVHILRATIFLGMNNRDAARKSYEHAIAIAPESSAALFGLADMDIHDNKREDAKKRYLAILDKDGNNIKAILSLAGMAAAERNDREYLKWLELAIKTSPRDLDPRAALVNFYLSAKQSRKAVSIAREAVLSNPNNPAALSMLGKAQMDSGDQTAALATYATMVEKSHDSAEANYRFGVAQLAANHIVEGRAALEKALTLQPSHAGAFDSLLLLDTAQNKAGSARQLTHVFQEKNPKSPLGFMREADILFMQKQYEQSARLYEQALNRGAGLKEFERMQVSLVRSGNTKLSDQKIVERLRQYPDDIALQRYAAIYQMSQGHNQEAIRLFENLRLKLPNDAKLLNDLASMYQKQKDSRALETAEKAYSLDTSDPAIADTYGWLLVEQGQSGRGLELLRYAMSKAKNVPAVRYHYAVALANAGNKSEARKTLEELLRTNQSFPESVAAKALLQGL